MKVFAISDLHLAIYTNKPMNIFGSVWDNYIEKITADWQQKVSDDDVVLIAGDISWGMQLEEAMKDISVLEKLKGKKLFIRGNHDYWWKSISKVRDALPSGFYAIQNNAIKLGDYIFCGTRGWIISENGKQTEEDKKIFNREVIRLELALKSAIELRQNNEQIICMIHYPPFNSKYEDSSFTKLMEKYNVSKVIYGHLHGKNSRSQLLLEKNGITYYLTSCDKVDNKLVLISE